MTFVILISILWLKCIEKVGGSYGRKKGKKGQPGKTAAIQQREQQQKQQQKQQRKEQREQRLQQRKISVSENWISICSVWERIMIFIKKWVHMKQ